MIGLLVALLAIVILLRLKVGVLVSWRDEEFSLKLRVGALRFRFPEKTKKPKARAQREKTAKPKQHPSLVRKLIPVVKEHWRELLALIGRVLRAPTLERLDLIVEAGGADPEVCVMNYGRFCGCISATLPVIQNTFQIKKQNVAVSCCYDRPKTSLTAECELFIRLGELIVLAFAVLGQLLAIKRSIKSTQEAV